MKTKLFLIFIAVLLFDGLVLPALFGIRESFLSLLLLVAPVVYIGSSKQCIICGLFFAFMLESVRGFELGSLAMPFLFTTSVIYLVQKVLDIRNTYNTRFSSGKFFFLALAATVFTYVFLFIYGRGRINADYLDPAAGFVMALEALVLIFIFNIIFSRKSDYQ